MTVEEIEIIVTAKIEEALREFKKIKPQVEKTMQEVSKSASKINMNALIYKVHNGIEKAKEKIFNLKHISEINEVQLKVSNEEASKQITELEKEIESLQKKISGKEMQLEITNGALEKMEYDSKQNGSNVFQNTEYSTLVNQSDKLNSDIIKYTSLLESAKSRLKELIVSSGKLNFEQENLGKKANKLPNIFNGINSGVKKITSSVKTLISSGFNKLKSSAENVGSSIRKHSSSIGLNVKSVLKYATALFSIKSVYSLLSQAASSWLSSGDESAKQISSNIEYMKYALGSTLAPIITYITNLAYQLLKVVQSIVYGLFKVNIFAKATASSYNAMGKNANKASKSLAGIHNEINNISNSNSNSGETPNIDLSQMDKNSNFIDSIIDGDWQTLGIKLGEKINSIFEKIPWEDIKTTASNIGKGFADFLNGGIKTIDWENIGNTLAQGINTALNLMYSFISNFDWKQAGKSIGDGINGFCSNVDWDTAGKTLGDGVKGLFDTIAVALEEIDWQEIAKDIEIFISNIDWNGITDSLFEGLGALVGGLTALIGTWICDAINGAKEYFNKKIEECGGNVVEGICKGIVDAISGIGNWIVEHIFNPFIDGFKKAFGIHSPSTVMAEMGGFIVDGLKNGISNIWEKISSIFMNLKDKIKGKFSEIKNNVSEFAENTKNTISTWANNSKEKISECWTNISNGVKNKIGNLKTNISNGLNETKTTIKNWASNAVTWGKDMVENMASGIRDNISKVTNAVSSVASKVKSFLGFSEPDEGPLSNFHTYMPDMIDLMTKGIKNGVSKVTSELENLTTEMSYTINTPNFDFSDGSYNNLEDIQMKSSNFYDVLKKISDINSKDSTIPINIVVNVGNKKIGQIAVDDIRETKRQTGEDLEAIFS